MTLTRKTPMKRGPGPKRKSRIKPRNAKRKAAAFERAYGGEARVAFVKSLPCVLAGQHSCRAPMDVSHITTGGVGRKADACLTVPTCRAAHQRFHAIGRAAFELRYTVDLDAIASHVEAEWRRAQFSDFTTPPGLGLGVSK